MTQYGLLLSISSSAYSHGLGQASQFSSNRLCEKKLAVHFFSFPLFFFYSLPSSKLQVSSQLLWEPWSVFTAGCTLSHISLTASLHWTFMQLPWPGMQTHIFVFLSPSLQIFPTSSPCWLLFFPSPTLTFPHTPPFSPFLHTGQWDLTCRSTCLCRILAIIQGLQFPCSDSSALE